MSEDLFRALLIVQPFFWMWVLEDDRFDFLNQEVFSEALFLGGLWFAIAVAVKGIKVGPYSTGLIVFYAFFVLWVCSRIYDEFRWPFRESLALAFLIVYLNSWYWEGVLHLWAIAENGFNLNQAFQMLHLIPGIYFLIRWEFDRREAGHNLLMGWVISGLISFARMGRVWKYLPIVHTSFTVFNINQGLMLLNRMICLWYLTNAIAGWGSPKEAFSARAHCPNFYKQ